MQIAGAIGNVDIRVLLKWVGRVRSIEDPAGSGRLRPWRCACLRIDCVAGEERVGAGRPPIGEVTLRERDDPHGSTRLEGLTACLVGTEAAAIHVDEKLGVARYGVDSDPGGRP